MSRLNQSSAVIEPTTAAVTSPLAYFSLSGSEVPARLTATNLAGSEVMSVFAVDGPNDVATAPYNNGVVLQCKATDPVQTIYAPGVYGLTKSATAAASAAYLTKGNG